MVFAVAMSPGKRAHVNQFLIELQWTPGYVTRSNKLLCYLLLFELYNSRFFFYLYIFVFFFLGLVELLSPEYLLQALSRRFSIAFGLILSTGQRPPPSIQAPIHTDPL